MLRQSAWESYADGFRAVRNTLTTNYATAIKQDVFTGRARRHESTRSASLFASNIPVEVFDNLLATFERHLPTWHRYWQRPGDADRRRHAAAVRHLGPARQPSPPPLHVRAVRRLDLRGARAARRRVRRNRASRLPRRALGRRLSEPGQDGRAPSRPARRARIPFILMSFDGDGREPRHAGARARPLDALVPHLADAAADLRRATRSSSPRSPRTSTRRWCAPICWRPSTTANFQIALLEEAMANFHRYFFIMPTLARFELEMHERVERGEGLTADLLEELMADLFREGYGREVDVRPRARRHHLGAVLAPVRALLRLPVRDRHLRRARAGAGRPRARGRGGGALPRLPARRRLGLPARRPADAPGST